MREAKEPFEFMAASYLIHIRSERAKTLGDLARFLRTCSEASIFYHTFQSLESHHYSAFSSDFAQWVLAACNEALLAERLAAVDVREYVSLEELREALVSPVEERVRENPDAAGRAAFEPFHFCEAREVTVPMEMRARTLSELGEGIRHLGLHSLHYHFINSRLRLKLVTNDFSHWIEHSLGLPALAARLNRIDFHASTLEGVRAEMLELIARNESR